MLELPWLKPVIIAGDIIGMVMWLDGCGFPAAVETLTGESRPPARPIDQVVRRQQADDDERRQHEKAAWRWRQRRPIIGTVAKRYLREVRGIACALPATLAYLPPSRPDHHPALIAAFALPDEPEPGVLGEPMGVNAIHLTLLTPDGAKAELDRPKLMVRAARLTFPSSLRRLTISSAWRSARASRMP